MTQQLRGIMDSWYYHHQVHLLSIHLSTYSGCCAVTALHSHFIHGSDPGLLHCRQIPYQLSHQGSREQCEELNILLKVIKLVRAGPDSDSKALVYSTLSSWFPGWDFFFFRIQFCQCWYKSCCVIKYMHKEYFKTCRTRASPLKYFNW